MKQQIHKGVKGMDDRSLVQGLKKQEISAIEETIDKYTRLVSTVICNIACGSSGVYGHLLPEASVISAIRKTVHVLQLRYPITDTTITTILQYGQTSMQMR